MTDLKIAIIAEHSSVKLNDFDDHRISNAPSTKLSIKKYQPSIFWPKQFEGEQRKRWIKQKIKLHVRQKMKEREVKKQQREKTSSIFERKHYMIPITNQSLIFPNRSSLKKIKEVIKPCSIESAILHPHPPSRSQNKIRTKLLVRPIASSNEHNARLTQVIEPKSNLNIFRRRGQSTPNFDIVQRKQFKFEPWDDGEDDNNRLKSRWGQFACRQSADQFLD